MASQHLRIIWQWSLVFRNDPFHHVLQISGHPKKGSRKWKFLYRPVHLLLEVGSKITPTAPHKAALAFINPLNLIVVNNKGRGAVNPSQGFHRIGIYLFAVKRALIRRYNKHI